MSAKPISASNLQSSSTKKSIRISVELLKILLLLSRILFFQDPAPPSTSLTNNDEVVDIKDVELTLLPSYLHDDAKSSQKDETSAAKSAQQQPPVPKRPPRNGGSNVEGTHSDTLGTCSVTS